MPARLIVNAPEEAFTEQIKLESLSMLYCGSDVVPVALAAKFGNESTYDTTSDGCASHVIGAVALATAIANVPKAETSLLSCAVIV